MANTIRIKRRAAGVGAGAPSGLANAELAYNEGDNILYYGFGTGGAGGTATQVIPIAGSGAYLNKNNNLSDLNNTQTSRNNLAGGTVTSGSFMRGNGTNVLMGSIIASDVPTLNQNTTGNAGTVTNGVYTSRTLTAGSGIAGGGDLSADRTFNIGQGDGITVSADSIAVDTTVVRTTGTQTINGSKTFGNTAVFNSGIQVKGQTQGTDPDINISNLTISSTDGASITINDNLSFSASNTTFSYFGGINGENVAFNDSDTGLNVLRVSDNVSIKAPAGASGSYFPVWTSNPSGNAQGIYSRTPAQLLGDIGGYASSNPNGYTTNVGTVTSVAALTLGTTGTDVTSTVATNTTTPVITLNIPTASASNRGALSSTDWSTFNNKAAANQTMFIGTTSVAINRSSASLSLAGTSIDGNAGSVTSGVYTSGSYADPSWISSLAKSKVGLTNVTDNAQVKKLASSTNGNIPIWNGTTGDALSDGYSVQTTLSSSSTAIPRADAVITYVDSLLAANDAMIFKGTLGSGGTITALPATAVNAGWTYRVITAGTYAGIACEIGDLVIAVADALGNINSTWTVVQTNIDGAVVGPASSTTNALAVFNGTTGKLIQNSSFVPTTVGGNLINLTNPGAISFLRINADNTITALSDVNFRTAIGAGTSSTVGTVTSVGGTGSTAGLTLTGTVTSAGSLTLGGTLSTPVSTINDSTTVGQNLVKLTNPSAITFLRINANNTVDALTDSAFRTAIGAGTSSTVGTVTVINAGSGMNYSPITSTGSVTLGTPSSITLSSTNSVTSTSHTHAFAPGGTTSQYIRGDGVATSGAALTKTDDTNVTLTIGGSPTNALLSATSLTLGWTGNLAVNRGGTGQTSYTNGELLIGNTTSNTLTKATLTQGSNVTITNGNGSITIASTDTNTATAADDILDGSNTGTQITYAPYATNQAASASPRFYNTADNPSGSGRLNVSAYFYATRLFDNGSRVVTASTICADAGNCTWDGGDF
jgi:hypothetical protein